MCIVNLICFGNAVVFFLCIYLVVSGYSKAQQGVSTQRGVGPVGARRRPELQGIYTVFIQQHFNMELSHYKCESKNFLLAIKHLCKFYGSIISCPFTLVG